MKPTLRFLSITICIVLCCISYACVDDVDFDQANEISITPRVDVDLIFFTVEAADFIEEELPDAILTVRDTTRLEFLNDEFVRENLKEIEFLFQIDNTFEQSLINRSVFLNNAGEPQYTIEFEVAPSTDGTPTQTSFTDTLDDEELAAIRSSIQLTNELILMSNEAPIDGELSLQSKAIYSLEFGDF